VTRGSVIACLLITATLLVQLAGCGGGEAEPQTPGSSVRCAEVVCPAQSELLGDMDGDDEPSVGDAINILRIVVGFDLEDQRADANENGSSDVGDAILVLRCVVGLDSWPIGTISPPPVRQDITAAQLQSMIDTSQQVALVDVRTNEEYIMGHIPGTINQPLANIDEWSERISKTTPICCICAAGSRSRQAADILIEKGFSEVYNLLGGTNGWPGDIETGCGCGP
jgi:rhodanese-related sulfurtransferase